MNPVLWTRIKTSVALIVPLAVILWLGGYALGLLAAVLFVIINLEYSALLRALPAIRRHQFVLANFLPLIGYFWASWVGFAGGVVLGSIIILLLNVVIIESETHEVAFEEVTPASMLGFVYLGLLSSMMVIVAFSPDANIRMAWLLSAVIFSDSLSYLGGSFIGGPKISPRISPNKTVAGSVCGLIGAIAASVAANSLLEIGMNPLEAFAFGALAGLFAQAGDLVESLVKRIYRVKDVGTWLPGHGGVLDRIDAFIFACPILFFLNL